MVIADPKSALMATESLLHNVAEMLVDAEGQARDGGQMVTVAQVQSLVQSVNDVLADVRARLAQMNGARS